MKAYTCSSCKTKNLHRNADGNGYCCAFCGSTPNPIEPVIEDPIDKVTLSPAEMNAAIYEGKLKKYFHEKNKHHWPERDAYEGDKGSMMGQSF